MTKYTVYFKDNSNRGSFAIDAIAETCGGDWTSSHDSVGIIEHVEDDAYMAEILDNDENVESYRVDDDD